METQTRLTEAYNYESFGTGKNFSMKILLDIGRDFTDTDKSNIRYHAEKLADALKAETERLDPSNVELAEQQKQQILNLFSGHAIFVEQIPSGYSHTDPFYKNFPWYKITTKAGRIEIGWRKRVIQIDWSDSVIQTHAIELFPNEDTTKEGKLIHAWGYEKAKQYIETLLAQVK